MTPARTDTLLTAAGFALGGFVLSWPCFYLMHLAGGFPPFWLASAVVFCALLRFPSLRRAPALTGTFVGLLIASLADGSAVAPALVLSAIDIFQIGTALWLLARLRNPGLRLSAPHNLAVLLLACGVGAPLIAAILRAALFALQASPVAIMAAIRWFAADAVGMVVAGSLTLAVSGNDWRRVWRERRLAEILAIAALVGAVAAAMFLQPRYPALFVIIPFLTFAVFRLRLMGAALSIVLVTAIGSVATLDGFGPIASRLLEPGERLFFLQAFIVVAVIATAPLAAILVERERFVSLLTSSERRFRQLIDAAPLAMFRCDDEGRVTYGNTRWTALIGEQNALWTELAVDADRAEARTGWAKAQAMQAPLDLEITMLRALGKPGRTGISLTPEAEGGWIGTAFDVDERHRNDLRIAESERQYRLLADHSNDMIVRIGLDGKRRYISPACRTILGHEPEEMLSETPIADIHAEDRARVERVCRSLLDGAVDPVCTYRQRRSDGSYAWLEATYRLVADDSGAPIEFVASVRDVGRRRAAEIEREAAQARLEESHRLLQMAEAMAGVGHWRLDAISNEVFWSDEVYHIHGRAQGDIPPLNEAILAYHADDRQMVIDHLQSALKDGRSWRFSARLLRPDGATRHVESSGQPERAPDGSIVGVVGVFRDITEKVERESALIAARDEARASAEAKSAFLATMSHEIRTPMTGVLGMIELLRSDLSPADRDRFFDNLEQSAALLMTVLDDVLDFSKIESRSLMLEAVDFDLGELLRNTLDLFHHAASKKGLLVTLQCPVGAGLRVRGDPVRLQQILSNLISNAIKFTLAGQIEVRARIEREARGPRVFFEVVDTGIGIDAAVADTLFEPFVQADPSTTRRFGGTGLGLAISKRLVEAMQGSIALDSKVGTGTTFRFDVRLAEARGRVETAKPARRAAARPLSILLAEDNQINRALIEAIARQAGHEIRCVENGALAVEAAAEQAYDIVLMDMQMPVMDGVAATRAIRAGDGPCADVPIVALTADASAERRRFYDNVGLTDFLTKPINATLLTDRLATIARRGKAAAIAAPTQDTVEAAVTLDEDKLVALETALGEAPVARLLAMLDDELGTRPDAILKVIGIGSRAAVASEAHALKGASFNIGAARVGDVARRLEEAAEGDADLQAFGEELIDAAHATRQAIDQRAKRRRRA